MLVERQRASICIKISVMYSYIVKYLRGNWLPVHNKNKYILLKHQSIKPSLLRRYVFLPDEPLLCIFTVI